MGLLGLALALSGIYGVMSWSVARRRREIGIRMAVGAGRPAVVGMVLQNGARLGAWGTGIGLALSLVLGRGLAASIFLPSFDWRIAVLVAIALFAMTLAGAYLPARRAARLDPNQVLRERNNSVPGVPGFYGRNCLSRVTRFSPPHPACAFSPAA